MHEQKIGRDAALSGVDELSPDNSACGLVEIGASVDNARILATKLQGDWREVRGCSRHDNSSYLLTAGEHDVIEALSEKRLRLRHTAFGGSDIRGVE